MRNERPSIVAAGGLAVWGPLLLLVLSLPAGGCANDGGNSESAGSSQGPAPRDAFSAEPSEELKHWLDTRVTVWQFADRTPEKFAEYTSWLTDEEDFTVEYAPGLTGVINGEWRRVSIQEVLDDICEQNNWQWDVVEPNKLLISPGKKKIRIR